MEYLRRFFAKRPLSGKTIKALAFGVSVNGLSDDKAATFFNKLSEESNRRPIMRGKILFLAERIVADASLLEPIRESLLKSFGSQEVRCSPCEFSLCLSSVGFPLLSTLASLSP